MVRALSRSSLWYWVCLSPVIGCSSSAMLPQPQWFWEWAGWDHRKTHTVEKLDSSGPCALTEMHQQQWCRRRELQLILCAPRRRPWHVHPGEDLDIPMGLRPAHSLSLTISALSRVVCTYCLLPFCFNPKQFLRVTSDHCALSIVGHFLFCVLIYLFIVGSLL